MDRLASPGFSAHELVIMSQLPSGSAVASVPRRSWSFMLLSAPSRLDPRFANLLPCFTSARPYLLKSPGWVVAPAFGRSQDSIPPIPIARLAFAQAMPRATPIPAPRPVPIPESIAAPSVMPMPAPAPAQSASRRSPLWPCTSLEFVSTYYSRPSASDCKGQQWEPFAVSPRICSEPETC